MVLVDILDRQGIEQRTIFNIFIRLTCYAVCIPIIIITVRSYSRIPLEIVVTRIRRTYSRSDRRFHGKGDDDGITVSPFAFNLGEIFIGLIGNLFAVDLYLHSSTPFRDTEVERCCNIVGTLQMDAYLVAKRIIGLAIDLHGDVVKQSLHLAGAVECVGKTVIHGRHPHIRDIVGDFPVAAAHATQHFMSVGRISLVSRPGYSRIGR